MKNINPSETLLSIFASSMESAIILCCGENLPIYCESIIDAMPMTSRLVLNTQTDKGFIKSNYLTSKDIRVAVHQQPHVEFINDIAQYCFNLVLLEQSSELEEIIKKIQPMLSADGIIVIVNGMDEKINKLFPDSIWYLLNTNWPDKTIVIRKRAKHSQPKVRKGGRRAKIKALSD